MVRKSEKSDKIRAMNKNRDNIRSVLSSVLVSISLIQSQKQS